MLEGKQFRFLGILDDQLRIGLPHKAHFVSAGHLEDVIAAIEGVVSLPYADILACPASCPSARDAEEGSNVATARRRGLRA